MALNADESGTRFNNNVYSNYMSEDGGVDDFCPINTLTKNDRERIS
jgi:hypothetical protein